MKNKKILIISIVVIAIFVCITVGVSLAFFNYAGNGTTDNTIETGSITFLYTEISSVGRGINITDAFPMSDTEGKALTGVGNVFDFNISATKTFNQDINFEVTARKKGDSTLDEDVVVMYLTKVNGINEEELLLDKYNNLIQTNRTSNYTEKVLYTGSVSDANYNQDYRLRMWITDDGTFESEDMGKTFTVTVNVYANVSVVDVPKTKLYTIVDDTNSNGILDMGDEINITGTNENFYVISNDGTNVVALAKYNLNVGNNAVSGPIGVQNALAIGFTSSSEIPYPGVVAFSNSAAPTWIEGEDAIETKATGTLHDVLENYKTILPEGTSVRLITKAELDELGCSISREICSGVPAWVYSTSYWVGTARSDGANYVLSVDTEAHFSYYYFYSNVYYGVRPVITIEV